MMTHGIEPLFDVTEYTGRVVLNGVNLSMDRFRGVDDVATVAVH